MSAKWNKNHENASRWKRFEPHAYFNSGRVVGFSFLGGLLGLFGSFVGVSNLFLGGITLLVGVVMLILGLNLTNISPRIGSVSVTLPKFLGKNIGGGEISQSSVFAAGAMSFLLPCGFTLAMEMYAISTGSFMTGALALGLFAVGTAPGLMSLGAVTAFFKGNPLKRFFRFTGIIVLMLGFYNISNAYNLLSLGVPRPQQNHADVSDLPEQEVRFTQDADGYAPNVIGIDPNRKIRLVVTGKNPYSCSSQLIIPSLGIVKSLTL